jgi:hypothetical protein
MTAGWLSADEVARAVATREQWQRVALSTGPCDRPAGVDAVRRAHAATGLPPPVVLWADSPVSAQLTLLAVRLHTRSPTGLDRLARQLGPTPVGPRLVEQLAEPRNAGLLEQAQGVDRLSEELWANCFPSLTPPSTPWDYRWDGDHELIEPVWDEARGLAAAPLWDTGLWLNPWGGPWDTAWSRLVARRTALGVPDNGLPVWLNSNTGKDTEVVRQVCEIVGMPLPRGVIEVGDVLRGVGRWWPFRGIAVLGERPVELHVDRAGHAHRDGGPAVVYPDGIAAHAWHGTEVPVDLVTGAGWAPERILAEPNAEVRRCAIERFGWDRFITATGMTLVGAERPDPANPGQVLRLFELPAPMRELYGEPARLLVVHNASRDRDGSRRAFGLPVPAHLDDPLAAAALTFAVDPAEYAGLERAT